MSASLEFARAFPSASAWFDAWVEAERGRFVLFLPVFLGAGAVGYFAMAREPALWPWASAACCLMALAALRLPVPVRAAALCLGMLAVGVASARFAAWLVPPWDALPRGAAALTGRVASVEALPLGRRVVLRNIVLDGETRLARGVRIRLRNNDVTVLAAGDAVAVRALLRPPPGPAYPGGWDVRRDAYFAGMGAYGFAIGPATRQAKGSQHGWQMFREAIAARIETALPGDRGAIAATLMTGLGAAIPPADRAAFQQSGLAHLLAVAGLHVGIVMGLFFALSRGALAASEYAALHWNVRRIAALISLAAGGMYLALTGGHVPILRSFAMASLVVLGVMTDRRAISLRALALAAFALLLISPQAVMGVSFQMSFSAVLALVAGYEVLRPRLPRAGAWRWLAGLLLTSLLAGTASLPFAAYHFGQATLYYVPANLLAVPLTAFWVMPCCIAALFLMPFGLEQVALAPAGWGIAGLLAIARQVASWPDASPRVVQMPAAALLLVAAGLIWLGLWRSPLRLLGWAPLVAGLAWWMAAPVPDLLVTPDARVIGVRMGRGVWVETARGAGSFEREAPARVWGKAGQGFPPAGAGDGWACDAAGCTIRLPGGTARLLRDKTRIACPDAAILLAPFSLGAACAGAVRVDRAAVARDGAAAISLSGGVARIRFAGPEAAGRPWGAPAVDAGDTPRLPPALTE